MPQMPLYFTIVFISLGVFSISSLVEETKFSSFCHFVVLEVKKYAAVRLGAVEALETLQSALQGDVFVNIFNSHVESSIMFPRLFIPLLPNLTCVFSLFILRCNHAINLSMLIDTCYHVAK